MLHARFGLLLAGLGALGLAAWAPGCLFAPDDCTELLKCPGKGAGGSGSTGTGAGGTATSSGDSTATSTTTTTSSGFGCASDNECMVGTTPSCDILTHTCVSCSDGIKNGTETGNDCGGNCQACNGEACSTAESCPSGKCVDGVCCDTDCNGTCKACNILGSLGTCSSVPTGQTDTSCLGLKACDGNNACKIAPGFACSDDAVCASGICFGGVCRVQNTGACTDDIACGSGLCSSSVCAACNAGNLCKSSLCAASTCKAPGGAPCEANSDCAGGICQNSFCMLSNISPCTVNEDCRSGYCNGGTCKPCSNDNDCPGPANCGNAYFGANICERPSGAYCFTDTQCATASGGKCVGFPAKCQ